MTIRFLTSTSLIKNVEQVFDENRCENCQQQQAIKHRDYEIPTKDYVIHARDTRRQAQLEELNKKGSLGSEPYQSTIIQEVTTSHYHRLR